MRRRLRSGPGSQNLDSFLDILTNTVGVLVFVLLFVSLAAADASILVHTPLRTETQKQGAFLETRADRVLYLDTPSASEEFQRMARSLPAANYYNVAWLVARLENFRTQTKNYNVDVAGSVLGGGIGLRYRHRSPQSGIPVDSLKADSSAYLRLLDSLDPEKDYIAFLVRPDGIQAFQVARDLAAKRGFQTGWEPIEEDDELIFGAGGRTIGVQ